MKMTNTTLDAVTNRLVELQPPHVAWLTDGLNGLSVKMLDNGFVFCKVEDVPKLIEDLNAIKKAIEDVTGVIL